MKMCVVMRWRRVLIEVGGLNLQTHTVAEDPVIARDFVHDACLQQAIQGTVQGDAIKLRQ